MSCPYVSALAALTERKISRCQCLPNKKDDRRGEQKNIDPSGYDTASGYGRINAGELSYS